MRAATNRAVEVLAWPLSGQQESSESTNVRASAPIEDGIARAKTNQALGPAKIVVVLQSDGAQETAFIFHMNERFLQYSWNRQGLRCQAPRTDRTNYAMRHERLAEWNMEDVWDRLGDEEMDHRERLRQHYSMQPGQAWGRLTNIPPTTFLYESDEF